jgi:hypothetical protein
MGLQTLEDETYRSEAESFRTFLEGVRPEVRNYFEDALRENGGSAETFVGSQKHPRVLRDHRHSTARGGQFPAAKHERRVQVAFA